MKSGKENSPAKKTRKSVKSKKTHTEPIASGICASQNPNITGLRGKSKTRSLRRLPIKPRSVKVPKKVDFLEQYYESGKPMKRKFNHEQIHFVIMQLIHIGRVKDILINFQERFGQEISREYVYAIKRNPNYEGLFLKLKDEYEKGLAREYLTSKRRRISACQDIFEKALSRKDYSVASQQVMHVENMMNPKASGFSVVNLTQHNTYADMNLQDIRKEKAKLLSQLEDAKIEEGEVVDCQD